MLLVLGLNPGVTDLWAWLWEVLWSLMLVYNTPKDGEVARSQSLWVHSTLSRRTRTLQCLSAHPKAGPSTLGKGKWKRGKGSFIFFSSWCDFEPCRSKHRWVCGHLQSWCSAPGGLCWAALDALGDGTASKEELSPALSGQWDSAKHQELGRLGDSCTPGGAEQGSDKLLVYYFYLI